MPNSWLQFEIEILFACLVVCKKKRIHWNGILNYKKNKSSELFKHSARESITHSHTDTDTKIQPSDDSSRASAGNGKVSCKLCMNSNRMCIEVAKEKQKNTKKLCLGISRIDNDPIAAESITISRWKKKKKKSIVWVHFIECQQANWERFFSIFNGKRSVVWPTRPAHSNRTCLHLSAFGIIW